jgi:3-dehydroquinate dehydratase II
MPIPVLEVPMTNIATREPWRDHSIISSAVKATIQGLGWRSYAAVPDALIDRVREQKEEAEAPRTLPARRKGGARR